MITEAYIRELTAPLFENNSLEVIDIKIHMGRGRPGFRFFVDHRERGITLEECRVLSRGIEDILDMAQDIPRQYSLDVSSPGVNHPLKHLWQFQKNAGRDIEVVFKPESNETEKRKPFKGKLQLVDGDMLKFEDGEEVEITHVQEAKVLLPW